MRYFQGRLCDKIGLVCDKLCDFFRANLHCFTRFQRRKTTLMLFNRQFECKGKIKHLLIFKPNTPHHTTLIVSEIKMAESKVSDVLQGFL